MVTSHPSRRRLIPVKHELRHASQGRMKCALWGNLDGRGAHATGSEARREYPPM